MTVLISKKLYTYSLHTGYYLKLNLIFFYNLGVKTQNSEKALNK